MSLKAEIETWVTALASYDNNEFDEALKVFENIADTSKILFNCGVIHATLGEHEKAVDCYQRAVRLDQYLAVAYFQQGVSNFLMGDFEEALANFNDTLLYLRGNNNIDYEQLGLKFKLYSCEVLFNRGLCYIYLQQKEAGMQDLSFAAKEKVVPDHDVIEEAIREEAEGYTVFSIPVGIVYRPNEAKVKNLKTKDYLGKARLVAAADRSNAFTGFTGAEIKRLNSEGGVAKDDRPEDKLSYAATNLVKPNLASRARQQSEPPLQRSIYPPTPPPEADKPTLPGGQRGSNDGSMSRAQSVRGGGPKPRALELGSAAFDQGGAGAGENGMANRPRPGTLRSASERPRPSREYSTSRRRDMPPRRRMIEEEDEEYQEEAYDMYQRRPSYRQRSRSRARGGGPPRRPMYIEEEDEEEDEYSSIDDAEFEMVSRTRPSMRSRRSPRIPQGGGGGGGGGGAPSVVSSLSGSGGSRRETPLRKIRVKVHAEDTRYVLIEPTKIFRDFVGQIRDKFGLRANFKIMIRDEGDMITMSDQDDLDMAIKTSTQTARREGSDMGKMEVWIQEV